MDDQKSEEFSSSYIMRTVSASETGTALRKLFVTGELIEKNAPNIYSEEEKSETLKKIELMAAKITTLGRTKSAPLEMIEITAEATDDQTSLQATQSQSNLEPTLSNPFSKKKKLWER